MVSCDMYKDVYDPHEIRINLKERTHLDRVSNKMPLAKESRVIRKQKERKKKKYLEFMDVMRLNRVRMNRIGYQVNEINLNPMTSDQVAKKLPMLMQQLTQPNIHPSSILKHLKDLNDCVINFDATIFDKLFLQAEGVTLFDALSHFLKGQMKIMNHNQTSWIHVSDTQLLKLQIQNASAWILVNICSLSSPYVHRILAHHVIHIVLSILKEPLYQIGNTNDIQHLILMDHCFWILTNILRDEDTKVYNLMHMHPKLIDTLIRAINNIAYSEIKNEKSIRKRRFSSTFQDDSQPVVKYQKLLQTKKPILPLFGYISKPLAPSHPWQFEDINISDLSVVYRESTLNSGVSTLGELIIAAHKEQVDISTFVVSTVNMMIHMLIHHTNIDQYAQNGILYIVIKTLYVLTRYESITDLLNEPIDLSITLLHVKRIFKMDHIDHTMISQVLGFINNLMAHPNESFLNLVLDSGIMNDVIEIFRVHTDDIELTKMCLILFSNIAAGSQKNIQWLIDQGVMEEAIGLLCRGQSSNRLPAFWVLENATLHGSPDQLLFFALQCHCFPGILSLLFWPYTNITQSCLRVLNRFFTIENKELKDYFLNCQGLLKLKNLTHHDNEFIALMSTRILSIHFEHDHDFMID
mmetsp:Transcript_10865/g.15929  ORF Transcript_10865/g.15929 Transcript_10865/m.15929 type:complete len:636 (-) Transcript_10865:361-2268(-)